MAEYNDDGDVRMFPIECGACQAHLGWSDTEIPTIAHLIVLVCDYCIDHPDEVAERIAARG